MKLNLSFISLLVVLAIFTTTSLAGWQGPKPIDHVIPAKNGFGEGVVYKIPVEVCQNFNKNNKCDQACAKLNQKAGPCERECDVKYPWDSDGAWNGQVTRECPSILKNQAGQNEPAATQETQPQTSAKYSYHWNGPVVVDHVVDHGPAFGSEIFYKVPMEVCENYGNAQECYRKMCNKRGKPKKGCGFPVCEEKHPWRNSAAGWNTQVQLGCPARLREQSGITPSGTKDVQSQPTAETTQPTQSKPTATDPSTSTQSGSSTQPVPNAGGPQATNALDCASKTALLEKMKCIADSAAAIQK